MTIGIYAIRLKATGEMYIQRSTNIERRFTVNRSFLNGNKHKNQRLQTAWNEHGADAFEFIVLKTAKSGEDLAALEEAVMKKHGKKATFNLDRGDVLKGKAGRKPKPTEATKPHTVSIRLTHEMKQRIDEYRLPEEKDQALFDRLLQAFFKDQ